MLKHKFNIKSFESFELLGEFIIEIRYQDGKIQMIDFGQIRHEGWWHEGWWKELEDPEYFKKVKINEIENLEWPHGQDFKPEHLYYWEKYRQDYM
ncbi:DUF2442 domain-containing protein [Candidatus Neptunochlamydia vexilliferae]|uniref:DUF2442 domain-containing protein n=1 Tax=Candidatus Neptunichlamydia vexilliferae TaxID=1651774 RepID=A0ABS0AXT0_9BACT|nr:DUF2442 domain-containing protein [Candidatus Neptunochlamydia vexilliferae]MBF5058938.1 hypothetical protein [Candidatus Neptunochlamydia vexilliferae]